MQFEVTKISWEDLDAVLERAAAERWTKLAFATRYAADFAPSWESIRVHRIYILEDLPERAQQKLGSLHDLASLTIMGFAIGDDGARALAPLTNLSSLTLSHDRIGGDGAAALAALTNLSSLYLDSNNIGDGGVHALAALTNLSSLDLTDNSIGDDGARALAALTNLSSLTLSRNSIGADGARALAALTNLSSLNLDNNSIGADGARALAALTNLSSLDLGDNNIGDDGARALAALTNLSSLRLWGNGIGDDGARALAALTNLSSLDLWSNSIGDDGARALAALTNLSSLSLWINHIGDDGARALAALTNLSSLNLGNNSIGDDGARALAALTNLSSLHLGNNSIGDDGARALAALTNLSSLHLGNNSIGDDGARALAALTNLSSLDLSYNRIGDDGAHAVLEAWSVRSAVLSYLNLRSHDMRISGLPAEVFSSTHAQAILAAYRTYREAHVRGTLRPLNEAKLLVVGNEAVGKTSLVRYLIRNEPRNPSEQATPRTAIHEKIDTQAWSPSETAIQLNVWDFGGQEIMRGTHQFFLTRRSIYLIVLEDRREDDRSVYEWLKTVRNRGGDSPVIIVINKSEKDPPGLRLDETALKEEYPQIVAFLRTSCDPGEKAAASIAALRQQIAETVSEHLPHVADPIPLPWLRVKEAVAEMARNQRVLDMRDYIRLCERPAEASGPRNQSITSPDEQRSLLGILHDIGVVVAHGLDRDSHASQREINLLDPNWLTGAIYGLITSKLVADQDGELGRDQINQILDPRDYPPRRHEFILDMMQDPKLGLCFEIPGSDGQRFLIPEALRVNQPDYGVWPSDSLRFRFEYGFLPPSLIPRFIVQAHRNLTDTPTRWKTGVVLEASGCKILVRGDRDKRRIDIQVAGPRARRRAALNVVVNGLEAVHKMNLGIGEKALVPLPDQHEVSESYEHLLKLEELAGADHNYLPTDANRMYTVRELLEGVRQDSRTLELQEGIHMSKIEVKIGDGATFHGDFAIGERIKNSFNKAQTATAHDDIKSVLQQLSQEVAKVAEKLSNEQAAELADDLGRLTDEATREAPKRKWWEISAKGIKEAAETVGAVGKQAVDLVKQLEGLLG